MVEALCMVKVADRLHQLPIDEILCRLAVSAFQCVQQWAAVSLLHALIEPVRDGILIDRFDFCVRDFHCQVEIFSGCILTLADLFEITGEKQEIPKVIL